MSSPLIRPELTFEEFCDLPLTYTFGVRFNDGATRQHMNTDYGFGMQTDTPYSEKTGRWGRGKVKYYLTEERKVYDTPDQLYVAYMAKVCGVPYDGLA